MFPWASIKLHSAQSSSAAWPSLKSRPYISPQSQDVSGSCGSDRKSPKQTCSSHAAQAVTVCVHDMFTGSVPSFFRSLVSALREQSSWWHRHMGLSASASFAVQFVPVFWNRTSHLQTNVVLLWGRGRLLVLLIFFGCCPSVYEAWSNCVYSSSSCSSEWVLSITVSVLKYRWGTELLLLS